MNHKVSYIIIGLVIITAVFLSLRTEIVIHDNKSPHPSPSQEPVVSGKCLVTGCSGQICSDEEVITTCEYKDEYACYKTAKCERQEDGKCGWTPTEDLVSCLGAVFQAE